MNKIEQYRKFLDAGPWRDRSEIKSDQDKGIPQPPFQKSYPETADLVDLLSPTELNIGLIPLLDVIKKRRSRRKYTDESLTLEELSFLLYSTQGVQEIVNNRTMRTVPSGGARHPFETYLYINNVEHLTKGIYRYLPLEHKLLFLFNEDNLPDKINEASLGQSFITTGSVVFFWTVVPYRAEWRYHILAHKMILIDVGHVCQNLYLAAESIGAGTCGIGAYDQREIDNVLGVDGKEELTVYFAPVGKIKSKK